MIIFPVALNEQIKPKKNKNLGHDEVSLKFFAKSSILINFNSKFLYNVLSSNRAMLCFFF